MLDGRQGRARVHVRQTRRAVIGPRRKLAPIGTEADGLDPALVLDGRQGCAGVHVRQTRRAVIGPRRKLAPIGTEADGRDRALVLDGRQGCAGVHVCQTRRVVPGPRRKLAPIGTEADGKDLVLMQNGLLACPSPQSHFGIGYAGATYGGSISFQGTVRQAQRFGRRLPQLRMSNAFLPGFVDRAASRQLSSVFCLGKNHVQHMLWQIVPRKLRQRLPLVRDIDINRHGVVGFWG